MNTEAHKSPSALDQLIDLTQTLEKEKVELTPEVEKYVREHVRAVQDRLQKGEDVYEKDLEFIEKVKVWVEAIRRKISLKQWQDLLHVAKAAGEKKEWIDETFTFPGGKKIEVAGFLDLTGCTGLIKLPEGLSVGGDLDLRGCTGLTELPEGLKVDESLDLRGCIRLTKLPEGLKVGDSLRLKGCTGLTELPEGLKVGWYLSLNGCTGLTELPVNLEVGKSLYLDYCIGLTRLPEGLKVGDSLNIQGCTSLTSLPEDIFVGKDLYLSNNLNEQIKKNAERLKVEGKINGEIKYEN